MSSMQQTAGLDLEDEKVDSNDKHFKVQAMLPWGFESKLAAGLALIKFPFILLCAFIGLYAEHHLKQMTIRSWDRQGNGEWLWGTVTGCYAHELRVATPSHSLLDWGILDGLNDSMGGIFHGDLWTQNVSVDPLHLMKGSNCEIDVRTCRVKGLAHPGFFTGGMNHWIPFSIVWLVYKLVFIGINPIDRAMLKMAGDPPPGPDHPEPLMKLLTEPHFQTCTTLMSVVVKFLFYFRYKMLPNTLLGALASMQDLKPHCPRLVHYTMSPRFGNTAYFMCIADLFLIFGAYWYCQKKMDGKAIGRWRYRLWKTLWMLSAAFFALIAVNAALRTFGGVQSILEAMFMSLYFVFTFQIHFRLNVDLLRVMTSLIFLFEGMELIFMVVSIVGPKVAPEFFERYKFLRSEQSYEELPEEDGNRVAPVESAGGAQR